MNWSEIIGWLGWVAAGILALAGVLKEVFGYDTFGKRLFTSIAGLLRNMISSQEFRKEVREGMKAIRAQVETNGGTSLKDSVIRIEKRLSLYIAKQEIYEDASERMLFESDNTGAVIFINDAFLKHFGYTDSDILGFGYEGVVHPGDRKEMREGWEYAIERGSKFTDEQRILNTRTGKYERCCVRAYPISEDGKLSQFAGTIDIINEP